MLVCFVTLLFLGSTLAAGLDFKTEQKKLEDNWPSRTIILYSEIMDPDQHPLNVTSSDFLRAMLDVEDELNPQADDGGKSDGVAYTLSIASLLREMNASGDRTLEAALEETALFFTSYSGTHMNPEMLANGIDLNDTGNRSIPVDQERIQEIIGDLSPGFLERLVADTNGDAIWDTAVTIVGLDKEARADDIFRNARKLAGSWQGVQGIETRMRVTRDLSHGRNSVLRDYSREFGCGSTGYVMAEAIPGQSFQSHEYGNYARDPGSLYDLMDTAQNKLKFGDLELELKTLSMVELMGMRMKGVIRLRELWEDLDDRPFPLPDAVEVLNLSETRNIWNFIHSPTISQNREVQKLVLNIFLESLPPWLMDMFLAKGESGRLDMALIHLEAPLLEDQEVKDLVSFVNKEVQLDYRYVSFSRVTGPLGLEAQDDVLFTPVEVVLILSGVLTVLLLLYAVTVFMSRSQKKSAEEPAGPQPVREAKTDTELEKK